MVVLSLETALNAIRKKYGPNAVSRGGDKRFRVERIPTGSLSMDIETGGGWAKGKINEIFGPYCLDGASVVGYHLPHWEKKRGKDRVRSITVAELFKVNLKNEEIYIEAIDESSGKVILNRVLDVYQSGVKGICRITTEHGFTLKSTTEHLYKTKQGYERLGDLQVGDTIAVVDRRKSFDKVGNRKTKEVYVRWHPTIKPRKHSLITGMLGGQGVRGGKYVRISEYRLVFEAAMNNLSVKDYIDILNNYDGRQLVTVPKGYDIHHIDFDYTNNRLENLELVESLEHSKIHANRGQASKTMLWDTITSIEYVENKITYDISMAAPNNNFIANGIVVHNSSGKSYVSYLTIATNQALYPDANFALIDFEGAFDEVWAKKIGIDKTRLLIASPVYMEEGLDIADALIKSGEMFLIIVDSWAAACPKAELEGEMGDFTVGLRARLGNKFIRKYRPISQAGLENDEVDLGKTTLLILNQIYQGIGPYAQENTPGGEQVKFGAMMRVRIRRGELLQDKDTGAVLAQQSIFVVEKNKTFPPKRKGDFWFSTSDNADGKAGQIWRLGELLTYAASNGIIRVAGPWFYLPEAFGGEKFQGKDNLRAYVREHPEVATGLEKLVMDEVFKGVYEQSEE